jgi:hypothetical protein|tara:strand:- start:818 stop:1165 length:348 start_codon:yes stop_codon:yes gene_type:complete
MAYMSQENKKTLAPAIKSVLKEYNMKGSIGVDNHSTLVVNLKEGHIDFGSKNDSVNTYWIDSHYTGIAQQFLNELKTAMMTGNHNNSDIMTDYFDVGWYIEINVGKWNKEYNLTA